MKPRITLASMKILSEISRYIQEYDVRGSHLDDAAPDVCDGAYERLELAELVRKRLLKIFRYGKMELQDYACCEVCDLCGDRFTVVLTDRAIELFWPERKNDRPHPIRKRPVQRARVRPGSVRVRNVRGRRTRRTSHNRKKAVS